jgi:hypothetical protein
MSVFVEGNLGRGDRQDRQTSTKMSVGVGPDQAPGFQTRYAQMSVCISARG